MCGIFVYTGEEPLRARKAFYSLKHRGPNNSRMKKLHRASTAVGMGFHRLAIQDLSDRGNQPISRNGNHIVCNGEIYNYSELSDKIESDDGYTRIGPRSDSDCEILLPLYEKFGLDEMVRILDAEFAFVLYDFDKDKFMAARDPIGIRPLFYAYNTWEGAMAFASEAKALLNFDIVKPFPPGHYYDGDKFVQYSDIARTPINTHMSEELAIIGIRNHLIAAVQKRLKSDAPIGFLLSGGLDSSIICAIAQRLSDKPIRTFSTGIDTNPIDTKYARIVAEHLGTDHKEVIFSEQDVLSNLKDLIWHLETWDITTIRAGMGMYLVCKDIWESTDIRVLMTGEVSDELFGYKYTDFAPSPEEFQKEAIKRIEELYMYDVLRADRCISAHGLEARVPFGDLGFIDHVMSISPEFKMNNSGHGKHLLRKAFEGWLPDEILYREKAAFSDAVGHRLVDLLKEQADWRNEWSLERPPYDVIHCPPMTREGWMYRGYFEKLFRGRGDLIKDLWMPNKNWENCDVDDPSARALPNYGKSGN